MHVHVIYKAMTLTTGVWNDFTSLFWWELHVLHIRPALLTISRQPVFTSDIFDRQKSKSSTNHAIIQLETTGVLLHVLKMFIQHHPCVQIRLFTSSQFRSTINMRKVESPSLVFTLASVYYHTVMEQSDSMWHSSIHINNAVHSSSSFLLLAES